MGSGNSTQISKNGNYIVSDKADQEVQKLYQLDPIPIGQGAYANVYKGHSIYNPDLKVAIKAIGKHFLNEEILDSIYSENKVLTTLDHPNIVKYYDTYEDKDNIFIVTKFVEGRTLTHLLCERRLSEMEACKIMYQLASAITHCHSNNIAHRDIKPDNIIVDDEGNVTLLDFGLSKCAKSLAQMKTLVGTPMFMAPEILKEEYTLACDIWSFGVLFYYILSNFIPVIRDLFGDPEEVEGIEDPDRNLIFNFPHWAEVSDEAKNLLRNMIVLKPEKRFTARQVMEHKWFDMLHDNSIMFKTVDLKILKSLKEYKCESIFKRGVINMLINMHYDELSDRYDEFKLLDQSGQNMIDKDDLIKTFKYSNQTITDEEADRIIANIDFSGNNMINYADFLAATVDYPDLCNIEAINSIFAKFDKEQTGYITTEDIEREFLQMGRALSEEEIQAISGSTPSFRINYSEFKTLFT